MKHLLLLLATCLGLSLNAQNFPRLKPITGGTVKLGGGYQFSIRDYYMVLLGNDEAYAKLSQGQTLIGEVPGENNPDRQVTISDFYLAETEVTNAQYRDFLIDSLLSPQEATVFRAQLKTAKAEGDPVRKVWAPLIVKAAAATLLPDTNCWVSDFSFSYNEPLVKHYLWHPSFGNYPVVGVSWVQAKAYCAWLSATTNAQRLRKHQALLPDYRLPTEAEWEYAARAFKVLDDKSLQVYDFPWKGNSVIDEKGQYLANIKTGPGDYMGDNYGYTAPVKTFQPNARGLFQMAGNASEWCEDVFRFNNNEDLLDLGGHRQIRLFEAASEEVHAESRVVKGGSWAEMYYAAMAGSRMGWPEAKGGSRIGFRVAMTKVGCECKNKQHCAHTAGF